MIIECPQCFTSYEIPVDLPEEGRKVRCAKCENVWIAMPPEEGEPEPSLDEGGEAVFGESGEFDEGAADETLAQMDAAMAEPAPSEEQAPTAMPDEAASFDEIEHEPIAPIAPDMSTEDDLDFVEEADPFDAAPAPEPIKDVSLEEENSQSSIDDMFNAPGDDIADGGEENSQASIDDMFSSMGTEDDGAAEDIADGGEENSQSSIDDMFSAMDEPEPEPEPEPVSEPEPAVENEAVFDASFLEQDMAPENETSSPTAPIAAAHMRRPPLSAVGIGALIASLLVFFSFAIFQRSRVVKAFPTTAGLYETIGLGVNLRGLEFQSVSYSWESDAGKVFLAVKGEIVNITSQNIDVPTVVFALRDRKGAELFHWAKNVVAVPLPAGRKTRFTARIPSPPETVRSLQVRFAKAE